MLSGAVASNPVLPGSNSEDVDAGVQLSWGALALQLLRSNYLATGILPPGEPEGPAIYQTQEAQKILS